MKIKANASLLALALGLTVSLLGLLAQDTRSVEGVVSGADNKAVVGAVVQLKDTKTLQIRSFITQQAGAYHFAGLSTNVDYEIKADHEGASSGTKTLSVFDNRKVATINLKLNK